MPIAIEPDRPAVLTGTAEFWKRQFGPTRTHPQIVFDVCLGIIVPTLCLILDPGIIRSRELLHSPLANYALFAYLEIGLCIAALSFYLITQRTSALFAGIFYAGAVFSLAVGIILLPLTLIALFAVIGIPGLTPFFTCFVFLRNARRCWPSSVQKRSSSAVLTAAASAMMLFLVPLGLQFETVRIANRALDSLQTGTDQQADRAITILKRTRLVIDTNRLVICYGSTNDKKQHERLARAYLAITGERIEDRLAALND